MLFIFLGTRAPSESDIQAALSQTKYIHDALDNARKGETPSNEVPRRSRTCREVPSLSSDAYNEEQASNEPGPKRGLSLFQIASLEFEPFCLCETKYEIILHKSTVARWVNHTSRPMTH